MDAEQSDSEEEGDEEESDFAPRCADGVGQPPSRVAGLLLLVFGRHPRAGQLQALTLLGVLLPGMSWRPAAAMRAARVRRMQAARMRRW